MINSWDVFKEYNCFFDRHFQHIRNRFIAVFNFQGFEIITFPLTLFALDIHVRQKVHGNPNNPIPLTSFAAPPFYVKRETSFIVSAFFGFFGRSKKIANRIKHASVSGWVGPWGSADSGLVDIDNPFDMFQTFIRSNFPTSTLERYKRFAKLLYKISLTSEDLPLPLTPVTTVKRPNGIATSMFFRLFAAQP